MACEPTARIVVLDAGDEAMGIEAALTAWMAADGDRATLALVPAPGAAPVPEVLAAFFARAAREGVAPAPAALALPAAVERPAELALEAAAACPGTPALHLMLPAPALEAIQRDGTVALAGGGEIEARRWWSGLLALAAAVPAVSLVPAVGAGWAGPSPGLAELVPAAARRLRLDLDFGTLVEAAEDEPQALARLAAAFVEEADGRLGPGVGPRRLALHLEGVGRAVARRGLDPGSFGALTWLGARLRAFRDGARAASVALARRLGASGGVAPFPVPRAFEVADTGVLERAMLTWGARHSHLLCLSPWSLAAPELGRAGQGLLPALKWADSIAWRRPPAGDVPAYGAALRFAWAVARAA